MVKYLLEKGADPTAKEKHLDYGSKEFVVVDCQVDAAQK